MTDPGAACVPARIFADSPLIGKDTSYDPAFCFAESFFQFGKEAMIVSPDKTRGRAQRAYRARKGSRAGQRKRGRTRARPDPGHRLRCSSGPPRRELEQRSVREEAGRMDFLRLRPYICHRRLTGAFPGPSRKSGCPLEALRSHFHASHDARSRARADLQGLYDPERKKISQVTRSLLPDLLMLSGL